MPDPVLVVRRARLALDRSAQTPIWTAYSLVDALRHCVMGGRECFLWLGSALSRLTPPLASELSAWRSGVLLRRVAAPPKRRSGRLC